MWKKSKRHKQRNKAYYKLLDERSLQYLQEERDYRKDLLDFKEAINSYAPKTRTTQISAILGFLEDNGYDIERRLKRDLYGKDQSPRTEEFIPSWSSCAAT